MHRNITFFIISTFVALTAGCSSTQQLPTGNPVNQKTTQTALFTPEDLTQSCETAACQEEETLMLMNELF